MAEEKLQNQPKAKEQVKKPVTGDKQPPVKVEAHEAKAKTHMKTNMGKTKKKKKKLTSNLWVKEIGIGVINLILILATIILLGQLADKAQEVKTARNASIATTTKSSSEIAGLELEASREKADKLKSIFPNESGLIDFVSEIDSLKEEGLITTFAFASEKAVKDKTGEFGIPIVIQFQGTWAQIGDSLNRLNQTPFLVRGVTIEANRGVEDGLITLKYGGFLYVDESLAKNR